MIFDEIVLQNFGVYRDRQSVLLSPPSPKKNVVLLGGLNGAGKTTFLDALQLALYGKMARCSNRPSGLAYDEFLRRSIHWAAAATDKTAIEVQFRHTSDGKEHTYRINRQWSPNGNGIREHVQVECDGSFDSVLTDSWGEYLESLIPLRISNLFFFDGEKIEGLADLENSAEMLSTAIHSLLGIDLVDKLTTDLVVLERRKKTASKNETEQKSIDEAQRALDLVEQRHEELFIQRGGLQNDLDRCEKRVQDIEAEFQIQGGDLYERQNEIEAARVASEEHLHEVEEQLREFAAGAAPLLLVADLLGAVADQNLKEEAASETERIRKLLGQRDAKVLRKMRELAVSEKAMSTLERVLIEDREKRKASGKVDRYHRLSTEVRELLKSLLETTLPSLRQLLPKTLKVTDETQGILIDHERHSAAIPDHDTLAPIMADRLRAREELMRLKLALQTLDAELERLKHERETKRSRLLAQIERKVELDLEKEDVARIIVHSEKARDTLEKFRVAVIKHHVTRIEALILQSLKQLMRKESLISDIKIDPERFVIQLYGKDRRVLPPERLSAGERQLLAISILWGLARTSGQVLPAIIDTPLGRLDATHRARLVERYFPYASHQVLLLSTDQEIDEHYYDKLRPWIGRAYNFQFDDSVGATVVRPGYLWSKTNHASRTHSSFAAS